MRLVRLPEIGGGTPGVLVVNGWPLCVTLELPWRDNAREVSCIPAGKYSLRRKLSIQYGDTFEVLKVAERSGILFHVGNYVKDSKGCVLVGETFGRKGDDMCVWQSKSAMAKLRAVMGDVRVLEIVNS